MINQLETHVFHQQKEIRQYLKRDNAYLQAWAPIAKGKELLLHNPVLLEISKKYDKTPAQLSLRFLIQQGIAVIPKSVHKKRMMENICVFDFMLTCEEMLKIESLDKGQTLVMDHHDPVAIDKLFARFRQ